MFASQTIWIVKQGKMDEALALLMREIEKSGDANAHWRVYTPHHSPNQLVFENTWETLEANQAFWDAYWESEAAAAFFPAWHKLVERSLGTYVWEVEVWP